MTRSGVTLALSSLVVCLLTACGNAVTAKVVGMAAVTQSRDHTPVLLIKVCKDDVDTVSVFSSREGLSGDQPNPLVASWTSAQPVSGSIRLSVEQPPAGWTPVPPTAASPTFEQTKGYIVLAQSSQKDVEVTQVSFHGRALRRLKPGQVLVRNSQVWSRHQFEQAACPVA
jgi:hypothetical protein